MKHEPELDRNHTPEDFSEETISLGVIFGILLIAALLAMAIFFTIDQSKQDYPIYIHDTETVSTVEREPLNNF